MTPEERARDWYHPAGDVPERLITALADMIRAAVEEEREACLLAAETTARMGISASEVAARIRARGQS